MNTIFIDIETVPADDPVVIERVFASVKPPGNLKKAESIDAWWKENGAHAKLEALAKTALNGDYGRVAVIGYRFEGGENRFLIGTDGEERDALEVFADICTISPLTYVAFNADFDIRFLWKRMKINRVPVPSSWPMERYPKNLVDPMRLWAGYGEYIKQTELERILGIERPADVAGADVAKLIADGKIGEVVQHCSYDLDGLSEIYGRLR